MAYSRTRYGTGYYIYHQFVAGHAAVAADRGVGRQDAAGRGRARTDRPRRRPTSRRRSAGTCGVDAESARSPCRAGAVTLARLDQAPAMIRALRAVRPDAIGRRVSAARGCASPGTTGTQPSDRRARRAVLRRRHALQPRRPRVSRQGVSQSTSASTSERVHLACYFPMPFFRSARRSSWSDGSESSSTTSAGRALRARSPTRRTTSATSTPPTATTPTRARQGPGPARHPRGRRRRRLVRQLRRHLVHLLPQRRPHHARRRPALLLRRQPNARRPTAPAPKSGAAAATTGAAAT